MSIFILHFKNVAESAQITRERALFWGGGEFGKARERRSPAPSLFGFSFSAFLLDVNDSLVPLHFHLFRIRLLVRLFALLRLRRFSGIFFLPFDLTTN